MKRHRIHSDDIQEQLIEASNLGDHKLLKRLIRDGGLVNEYVDGKTPLHIVAEKGHKECICLLYTSPSPRDRTRSRMPSSA